MELIKNPTGSGQSNTAGFPNNAEQNYTKKSARVKQGTKEFAILSCLASGKSLNRFEAIRLHDTALNSTISTLQSKGLSIHRERESVLCVDGTKTIDVCRYSLTPDQVEKALMLMGVAA